MTKTDRKAKPYFSQPIRQIALMILVMGLVGLGGFIAYPSVADVFWSSIYLNAFILFVFVIGIFTCLWQVFVLIRSVSWIESFAGNVPGHEHVQPTSLLAPLAAMLASRGAGRTISASSSRSILESVETRIEEARDITRYITSLLVFLGLLGTFYGLATTVPAVVETIRSLSPSENESGVDVFARLMSGLEGQLGGMGTAFGSSLLGLMGSLVIGLLELFTNHGQNRFFRELENWMSSITRLGFSHAEGEGGSDTSVLAQLGEHLAQQSDALQTMLEGAQLMNAETESRLSEMVARIGHLADAVDRAGRANPALEKIAEGQQKLVALFEAQSRQSPVGQGGGMDAESRMRLRSIDVQLLRILEELSAGRQETIGDLRMDLANLTKAVKGKT
jgi:hypothetical protein